MITNLKLTISLFLGCLLMTDLHSQSCVSIGHTSSTSVDSEGMISVSLDWDALSIGEEYQVNYTNPNIGNVSLTPTTSTSATIAQLDANTTYSWRVRVKCGGEWSQWPSWQGTFTTPDGVSCASSGHTSSTSVDSEGVISVSLGWDAVSIGEEYQVNYTNPNIGNVSLTPTTSNSATIAQLDANTTYSWRVRVKCGGEWSQWPSWQGTFKTPEEQLCELSLLQSAPVEPIQSGFEVLMNFKWQASGAFDFYEIRIINIESGESFTETTSDESINLSLIKNSKYAWELRGRCNGQMVPWQYGVEFKTPYIPIEDDYESYSLLRSVFNHVTGGSGSIDGWPSNSEFDQIEADESFFDRTYYSDWPGVEVNQFGRIRGLTLNNLNIDETIFSILGEYEFLQVLDLSSNSLEVITSDLIGLTNLTHLNLSNNKIRSLNEDMIFLSSLLELDLSYNNLNNRMPLFLLSIPNLTTLNLSNNSYDDVFQFWLIDEEEMEKLAFLHLDVEMNDLDYEQLEISDQFEEVFGSLIFENQKPLTIEVYINGLPAFGGPEGDPLAPPSDPMNPEPDQSIDTVVFNLSDNLEISVRSRGEDNIFSWFRSFESNEITLEFEEAVEVQSMNSNDEGWYYCVVSSGILPYEMPSDSVYLKASGTSTMNPADQSQYEVLKDLYFELGGDNWNVSNWPSSADFIDIEIQGSFFGRDSYKQWDGITVENGKVVRIALSGIGLSGELPESLSDLVELTHLDLSNNDISGSYTFGIQELDKLQSLNLSDNEISELIWPVVGLESLKYLNLSENQLTSIAEINWLDDLEYLNLSNNNLAIVDRLNSSNFPNLRELDLSYTNLRSLGNFDLSLNEGLKLNLDYNKLGYEDFERFFGEESEYDFELFFFQNQNPMEWEEHNVDNILEDAGNTIYYGRDVTHSLNAIPGSHNVYQWQRSIGGEWVDFGEPGRQISFENFQYEDYGGYRCIVDNSVVPLAPFTSDVIVFKGYPKEEVYGLYLLKTRSDENGWYNTDNWPNNATLSIIGNSDRADRVAKIFYPIEELGAWHGVTVEEVRPNDWHITAIELPDNNLSGRIRGLNELKYLKSVILSGNTQITGIDYYYGDYPELIRLELDNTSVTTLGPNPNLTFPKLQNLDISLTDFQNVDELWGLESLKQIDAYSTRMSGSISSEIGNLTELEWLNLSHSSVSGEIPDEIGNLTKLWFLNIGNNRLSGDLPASFDQLTNLEYAYLQSNSISGEFPFNSFPKLDAANLSFNHFSSIPNGKLDSNPELIWLWLNNNDLTGNLSNGWVLPNLVRLDLGENDLEGTVPSSLLSLPKVYEMNFSHNSFSDLDLSRIDESIELVQLNFSNNNFSGIIPSAFISAPKLGRLILDSNQFSGSIPLGLINKPEMTYLTLSNNKLSGITASPGQVTNTELLLYIDRNELGFAALEPFFSGPGESIFTHFRYGDQDYTLGEEQTLESYVWFPVYFPDDEFKHEYDLEEANNFYKFDLQYYRYLGPDNPLSDDEYIWQDYDYFDGKYLSQSNSPEIPYEQYGKTYRFKVTHDYVTGLELFTNEINVVANDEEPDPIDGLAVIPLTPKRNLIVWEDDVNGENGFQIARSSSSSGHFETVGFAEPNATSYVDPDLDPNTTYYYRINVYYSDENVINSSVTKSGTTLNYSFASNDLDSDKNWVLTKSFDDDGEVIAMTKSFINGFGKVDKSLLLNNTEGDVIVQSYLYDSFGRSAGQDLPYARMQTYTDSDPNISLYYPDPTIEELHKDYYGNYYNSDYLFERNHPSSEFSTSRIKYREGTGEVQSVSMPGAQFALGEKNYHALTLPADISELPDYMELRAEVLGTEETLSPIENLVKQVMIDPQGETVVSYFDQNGQTIATAIVEGDGKNSIEYNAIGYINIHVSQTAIVELISTGDAQVYDILSTPKVRVGAIEGLSKEIELDPGFYQIKASSVNAEINVSYNVNYSSFSYYIYDLVGRLLEEVSPNGVEQFAKIKSVEGIDKRTGIDKVTYAYDQLGNIDEMTESDAGTTKYIYREDGVVRYSQNAHQASLGSNFFSYSDLDDQDRVIEYGVHTGSGLNFGSAEMRSSVDNHGLNSYGASNKEDWLRIKYDLPDDGFSAATGLSGYEQTNLKGAVSYTYDEDIKTWYSYDVRGRLKWQVQKYEPIGKVFTLNYYYDPAGNVATMAFQKEEDGESFYHHYEYDRDQRLKKVLTSTDGELSNAYEQANYQYYLHGPLKRVELAEDLQGIDYTYTIQGWLKSINGTSDDPGNDGKTHFPIDAFGSIMEYFQGDYQTSEGWYESLGELTSINDRFDGNVRAIRWHTVDQEFDPSQEKLYAYNYDTKGQLSEAVYGGYDTFDYSDNILGVRNFSYDANGNLLTLNRYDEAGSLLHEFNYTYTPATVTFGKEEIEIFDNRLDEVPGFLELGYDALGRVTDYEPESPIKQYFSYDHYNRITKVENTASDSRRLAFTYGYNNTGDRILKKDEKSNLETWYVRDPSGNILSIYYRNGGSVVQGEVPIYGDGVLGMAFKNVDHWQYNYALTDHQGNTRAMVTKLKFMGTATMEESLIDFEATRFENLDTRHHDDAKAIDGSYSALLNPALSGGQAIGPAKSLQVKKGDVVKMEVLAAYDPPSQDNTFVMNLASLLANALNINTGTTEGANALNGIDDAVTGDALVPSPTDQRQPKAYLQFLTFDEDYTFNGIESGNCACFQKVTDVAATGVETLSLEVEIEKDGYIFIYVANESSNDVNVWFDNLTVTHLGPKLVQATDYYPFGSVASQWTEEDYRFGYQGQFAEDDTEETGLNYFMLRDYDPTIGRWLATDPYGQYWSPYAGMGNSPHLGVDPDGGWFFESSFLNYGFSAVVGAAAGVGYAYLSGQGDEAEKYALIGAGVGVVGYGTYDLISSYGVNLPTYRIDPTAAQIGMDVAFREFSRNLREKAYPSGTITLSSLGVYPNYKNGALPTMNALDLASDAWGMDLIYWGAPSYPMSSELIEPLARGTVESVYPIYDLASFGGARIGTTVGKKVLRKVAKKNSFKSIGAAAKGFSGKKSINQLNQLVKKGKLPNTITRFDKGKIYGELDHVHFSNGAALNVDGTWKHGIKELTNKEIKILSENGWIIPN